jgi:hypothetical protein
MLPVVNLSDGESASFCKNNEIPAIPYWQMYVYTFVESNQNIKNNKTTLLTTKNISLFHIYTTKLPVHKELIKVHVLLEAVLVTYNFYCTFPDKNIFGTMYILTKYKKIINDAIRNSNSSVIRFVHPGVHLSTST